MATKIISKKNKNISLTNTILSKTNYPFVFNKLIGNDYSDYNLVGSIKKSIISFEPVDIDLFIDCSIYDWSDGSDLMIKWTARLYSGQTYSNTFKQNILTIPKGFDSIITEKIQFSKNDTIGSGFINILLEAKNSNTLSFPNVINIAYLQLKEG